MAIYKTPDLEAASLFALRAWPAKIAILRAFQTAPNANHLQRRARRETRSVSSEGRSLEGWTIQATIPFGIHAIALRESRCHWRARWAQGYCSPHGTRWQKI